MAIDTHILFKSCRKPCSIQAFGLPNLAKWEESSFFLVGEFVALALVHLHLGVGLLVLLGGLRYTIWCYTIVYYIMYNGATIIFV